MRPSILGRHGPLGNGRPPRSGRAPRSSATAASAAIGAYAEYLEKDLAPRSKGSFRLGRERFEEKLRLDEGLTIDSDRLLTIALRELATTQQEFYGKRLTGFIIDQTAIFNLPARLFQQVRRF